MDLKHKYSKVISSAIGMMVLILDSKTALEGAAEGLTICIQTVIPSLFPFIFLSTILTNSLSGRQFPILRPLGRFCGMPEGSESYFLVGILGGYPTGADCITNGYCKGLLTKDQAERLLGFCSNAGPAFLFGMAGHLFSSPYTPWILWAIHIISALVAGHFLPKASNHTKSLEIFASSKSQGSLSHTLRVMASICGWVVLFRILIGFCNRWFLWLFPTEVRCVFTGLLELSNGCCSLAALTSEAMRFLILSCFLAFGGFCVTMQTLYVTEGLSLHWYLIGKLLQTTLSFLLSIMTIPVVFQNIHTFPVTGARLSLLIFLALLVFLPLLKKTVAIPTTVLYNDKKP